nr:MAG TPA: hypothetical protein [Caudoviricetes sp.]
MAKNTRMCMIIIDNTRDLKSLGVRAVWVQVPLRLPWETKNNQSNKQCRINHRKVVFYFLISLSHYSHFSQVQLTDYIIASIYCYVAPILQRSWCVEYGGLYKHVRYW